MLLYLFLPMKSIANQKIKNILQYGFFFLKYVVQ